MTEHRAQVRKGTKQPVSRLARCRWLFLRSISSNFLIYSTRWSKPIRFSMQFDLVAEILEAKGFKSLCTRRMAIVASAPKSPFITPDDLKAYKMRSQESPSHLAMYGALVQVRAHISERVLPPYRRVMLMVSITQPCSRKQRLASRHSTLHGEQSYLPASALDHE